MKNLLIMASAFIASAIMTTTASALDLREFHDKNYEPIGYYCGLHVEVSGKRLYVTNIIPPNASNPTCETGQYSVCNSTIELQCDSDGLCESDILELQLLEDGNIFSRTKGTKFVRSPKYTYYWCNN